MHKSRTENRLMTPFEWLLLGILSIIWGCSFLFMKTALNDFTPFPIVTIRVGVGALVISLVVIIRKIPMPRSPKAWGEFSVMALLNNVIPFSLLVWGMQYIDSSLGSILNATTPIFSIINVHLLTREDRLTANRITGIIIGWIGVIIMIGLGALQHIGNNIGGQVAVLGASCSYSLAAIYGRRFSRYQPLAVTSGMLTCATILSLPLTLIYGNLGQHIMTASVESILAAVLLGILSTGIAYLFYYRLLTSAGPTNVLLVTFLVPVTAILLGTVVLGERMALTTIAGAVLLFIGLIIIDGRVLKKRRNKQP